MYKHHTISVVFPAYNEEQNIAEAVASFKKLKIVDEILVVDNNSTDRTSELATRAGATVVKEKKQGYGFALRRGISQAKGDYIVLCEPDGTFLATDIKYLLKESESYDVVVGTRTNPNFVSKKANMGYFLRLGNISVAKVMQLLYLPGCSLSDCGCTYRLLKKNVVKKITPKLTVGGSYFLSELSVRIIQEGFSMIEIPVHYQQRIGQSKITGSLKRALWVGWKMFSLIVAYRFTEKTKNSSLSKL